MIQRKRRNIILIVFLLLFLINFTGNSQDSLIYEKSSPIHISVSYNRFLRISVRDDDKNQSGFGISILKLFRERYTTNYCVGIEYNLTRNIEGVVDYLGHSLYYYDLKYTAHSFSTPIYVKHYLLKHFLILYGSSFEFSPVYIEGICQSINYNNGNYTWNTGEISGLASNNNISKFHASLNLGIEYIANIGKRKVIIGGKLHKGFPLFKQNLIFNNNYWKIECGIYI